MVIASNVLPLASREYESYLWLQENMNAMIDAASGGLINNKNMDEVFDLIDTMASNNYSERCAPNKSAGVFEIDQNTAIAAQMSMVQSTIKSTNERNKYAN